MSRWNTLAAAAILVAAAPTALRAQEGTVAGTVTATGSDEPLTGAIVTVVGGTQRASADAQGRFRIAGLTGPNVTLEARRIGYRVGRTTVRSGETHARIVLVSSPQSLEAVVVSASGGRAEKKAIGNSVATVDAAAATEIAPINSMQGLLNGRAPGVVIQPATGAVGSGGRIRVRGNASFSLSNEPLLYVDGVRVNNNPSSGPQNQDFGSSSISRINDLNPDDIESIEILKGPAAAALYGTEASNGVIQVITKRGSGGVPRWNFITRQGINYFQDWSKRFWTNYGTVPRTGGPGVLDTLSITMAQIRDTLSAYGFNRDVFRNGRRQQTELSVNGGSDVFSYFASGNYLDDAGAEPNNYQRKASGRVNLGVTPNPNFRISINAGAVAGPTYLSCEAGCGGRVWTLTATTPSNCANKWTHCLYSSIPEAYDETYNFWQDMNRLSSSVRFDHTPATWFTQRLTAGIDRTGEQNVYYTPRIDSLLASTQIGSDALGSKDVENREVTYASLDYAATASRTIRTEYSTATTVGAQYYRDNTHATRASGCVFPLPGLLDISATNGPCSGSGSVPTEDGFGNATLGVYGQEQVGWRDMLFLTAAIRSDNSSAFGTNYSRAVYPKFSVSWVASQTSFIHDRLPSLTELRFRAAYGEAGKAPATYSATRTFTPTPGYNNTPSVTAGAAGNPNLRPERGKEVELGFDASGYNDRVGMEFTYYRKRTTDAILDRELAPSLGYSGAPIPIGAVSSGTQPFNAGVILNSGTELLLRATPYQSDKVNWDATFTLATNTNKVVDLGTPGLNFVTAGTYGRHQVGFPVGAWFEQRVVSAVYDPTTGKAAATCDNGSGGTMPCYGADGKTGTADDAPDLYLGRSTPPTEGSFSSTITLFRNFRVYGLIDFQNGWSKMNGNQRVRCTVAIRCFENYYPAQSDPVLVAEYQSNRQLVDRLIQDASFTKLRELTFAYDVPERFAQRLRASRASIAISGHNLHTWTKYQGLEPEATFLSGTRGGFFSWEQTTLPQLTQWTASLSLTL